MVVNKRTKWTIELVDKWVQKNTDSRLLSREYVNVKSLLAFECKCGAIFQRSFAGIQQSSVCKKCSFSEMGERKVTTYSDVKKFVESVGCRLLSSAEEYSGNRSVLTYACRECGNPYSCKYNNFKSKEKYYCNMCSFEKRGKDRRKPWKEIVAHVTKYSTTELLSECQDYKGNKSKLHWRCSCGEEYYSSWNSFYSGGTQKCPKCNWNSALQLLRKSMECFQRQVIDVHNGEITVEGTYVNQVTPLMFGCKKCAHHWYARPKNILKGNGCPACAESTGEVAVRKVLTQLEVAFQSQYKYSDCRSIRELPFDFAVFDGKERAPFLLIEYDGEGHYKPIPWSNNWTSRQAKENLVNVQLRDGIKDKYCREHNIPLLRIPYWQYAQIEQLITEKLNELNNIGTNGQPIMGCLFCFARVIGCHLTFKSIFLLNFCR